MKVYVPYVDGKLEPRTREWARETNAIMVRMWGDHDYWALFRSLWIQREAFVIVEHDVVPATNVINDMWHCDELWCGAPTKIAGVPMVALGCTKFEPELMNGFPRLVEEPPLPWWGIDGRISEDLRGAGLKPHEHKEAEHLNPFHQRVHA